MYSIETADGEIVDTRDLTFEQVYDLPNGGAYLDLCEVPEAWLSAEAIAAMVEPHPWDSLDTLAAALDAVDRGAVGCTYSAEELADALNAAGVSNVPALLDAARDLDAD